MSRDIRACGRQFSGSGLSLRATASLARWAIEQVKIVTVPGELLPAFCVFPDSSAYVMNRRDPIVDSKSKK